MSDNGNPISSLSTVGVVLFIAAGALFFVLAALLTKRQISRFKLRSSRRPHVSIGSDAPKVLRQTIQEKLDNVCKIKFEPLLLNSKVQQVASSAPNHYYHRMKAVDAFSRFDEVLKLEEPGSEGRHPNKTVRHYLLGLYPDYLTSSSADLIHQFSDAYEHARHDPAEFGEPQYDHYMGLLEELLTCLKVGVKNRSSISTDKAPRLETQVIFKPEKGGETQTQTLTSGQTEALSTDKDSVTKPEIRQRARAGSSSAQSSFMDSGHSSHQSTASVESFHQHSESQERIVLLELDKKGQFV